MARNTNAAIRRGVCFCILLAACDSAQPTDPTSPHVSEAAHTDLQSLSNSWAVKHSLSPDRQVMAAGAINGVIYAVGGRHIDETTRRVRALGRVDAYYVASNMWSQVASMPGAREEPNGASVINGRLYVTGGRSNGLTPQGFFKPTKTLFVYDPGTDRWARKADMPQAGCGGVQGVINGMLYVFMPSVHWCDPAGSGGDALRFYRYNPATDAWVSRAVPPGEMAWGEAKSGTGGAINGKFYLVGPNSRLFVYDPVTNSWMAKASMSASRSDMEAAVLNGRLFLVGGYEWWSDYPLPTLEIYNPQTNSWMLGAPVPDGTVAGAAVSAGGRIYYVAGRVERELPDSRVYAYTP